LHNTRPGTNNREEPFVPTNTQRDIDLQRPLLDAVRESQAAVIDVLRAWTDMTQQLTRDLRLPIAGIDLAEAVDRVFDIAEQTLAAQRELALTVAGVTTRQVETVVDTAVDTTVEAVEATREQAPTPEPPRKPEPPRREASPDRRSYEERSIEELRERARELEIESRSSMSKDELIAALRKHSR
jgi:hypothetical protein